MKTDVKEKNNSIQENIRLNKAFYNYKKIIAKNLPYKFSYLDEWMLKSSKLLLNETRNTTHKYRTYKRGTIIKVDFGVNLGSEMSQVHFAVVLSKNDNPRNNVLTILPLTTKKGKFNICLGTLIAKKIVEKLNLEEKKLKQNLAKLENEINCKDANFEKIENEKCIIKSKMDKLNFLIKYYKNSLKTTYGCTNLITSISKTKLLNPINEYDIIGKTMCSDEVLDIIDNDITQKFTNLHNK